MGQDVESKTNYTVTVELDNTVPGKAKFDLQIEQRLRVVLKPYEDFSRLELADTSNREDLNWSCIRVQGS